VGFIGWCKLGLGGMRELGLGGMRSCEWFGLWLGGPKTSSCGYEELRTRGKFKRSLFALTSGRKSVIDIWALWVLSFGGAQFVLKMPSFVHVPCSCSYTGAVPCTVWHDP
jgi:hypothetical protein